jgi:hypothetical protein
MREARFYLRFFLPRAQDWRIFSAIKARVAALMTRLRRRPALALPAVFPVGIEEQGGCYPSIHEVWM